ncbi:prolyl oligopeptidase family serine peptidase [Mobiluncus mulieris]|nr:prolyl oligopeptidase family serine peptidase [Mobiluncus mulieris]
MPVTDIRPGQSLVRYVRGEIKLSDGTAFFPSWQTTTHPTVFGGYLHGCEALICETYNGKAKICKTGEIFPSGHHLRPVQTSPGALIVQSESFLDPPSLYRVDLNTGSVITLQQSTHTSNHLNCHWITVAKSQDDTPIPVDCYGTPSESCPTVAFVYGGFMQTNHSFYSHEIRRFWLDQGFNIALIHSRGGYEYGKAWHQAGTQNNRYLVRSDVVAALRQLHKSQICDPKFTFLHGMSHGALVAALTTIYHPELVSHVVCRVPISATKNLPSTEQGKNWMKEYGDPRTQDWEEFMQKEDPLCCPAARGCLANTSWLITGYSSDVITGIYHADCLAARAESLGAKVTYWRYSVEGGHEGPLDPVVRRNHEQRLWKYLNYQATKLYT